MHFFQVPIGLLEVIQLEMEVQGVRRDLNQEAGRQQKSTVALHCGRCVLRTSIPIQLLIRNDRASWIDMLE